MSTRQTTRVIGAPCACGGVLVLCWQRLAAARCLTCEPYQEVPAWEQAGRESIRTALRTDPAMLFVSDAMITALPIYQLLFTMPEIGPGLRRDLGIVAGITAFLALLVGIFLTRAVQFVETPPACRLTESTPADWWLVTGALACFAQSVLWNLPPI